MRWAELKGQLLEQQEDARDEAMANAFGISSNSSASISTLSLNAINADTQENLTNAQ